MQGRSSNEKILAEKTFFVGFDVLLPSTEFQTEPLVTLC